MPPKPSAVPEGERNLYQARETIKRLRAQLKATAPNTSAELRMSADPLTMVTPRIPAGTRPIGPPPSDPHPTPHPGESPPKSPGYPPPSPGNLSPASMKEFLSQRTDRELQQLLAVETGRIRKEQRPELIAKLYREIRERRK